MFSVFCEVLGKSFLTSVWDSFVSITLCSVKLVVGQWSVVSGQLIENIKWVEDNSIETDTCCLTKRWRTLFKQIAIFIGLTFPHKTHNTVLEILIISFVWELFLSFYARLLVKVNHSLRDNLFLYYICTYKKELITTWNKIKLSW